jgi:hypothetical protein
LEEPVDLADSIPPSEDTDDDSEGVDGADLVAEFEKVVNSQAEFVTDSPEAGAAATSDGESSRDSLQSTRETGTVVMADELGGKKEVDAAQPEEVPVHPKLKNVNPDSKEEAEVFITELKSLKRTTKSPEDS